MQEEGRCGSRGEQERVVRVEHERIDGGLVGYVSCMLRMLSFLKISYRLRLSDILQSLDIKHLLSQLAFST